MADALLVCEDIKTLAALQRQFIETPDASNMADFLRISPWNAEEICEALRASQVSWAIAEAQRRSAPKVIYINDDDSLGEKDKQTTRLEPIDWFPNHGGATKGNPRYKKGFCYVECTLRIGEIVVTADLQLYLRAKTVRRINRGRAVEQRIPFRSKYSIVRGESLRPLLPKDWTV